MRPFRFLASAAAGVVDARELTATARRAESTGFGGLVLPDHLVEQHAPVPVLATVAAVTERLRIGSFVLNAGLRHPAVLAQDLASLDVLSGGRLDVGIGAGWNRPEHDAVGLPFDPLPVRFARLREAVAVLKGCFADGPFSYAGEHYTIAGHDGLPKPVQRPSPPLLIGGGGRRLLTYAAQEAQVVGLAPRLLPGDQREPRPDPRSMTAAATEEKVGWVRAAAGDRFDQLELNAYPSGGPVVVTNHARSEAQDRADRLRKVSGIEITAEEVLESPHIFIGSVPELTRKVLELRERFGISSITTGDLDEMAPVVEQLAGR
jgi:probable F420-dependent oxidoreductase